ncbi:MAG: hypothetical protein NC343_06280 [Muribaculum sp.]|nr:hypothetical protein [Muribaculaceae bacterium]MCM1081340.1 hypothetical protein [Muribaculum sp.]
MSNEGNKSDKRPATPAVMRNIFGVIMIIVYVGMGILFLCGFFNSIVGSWTWLRWVAGVLLVVYGFWRGYRQFSGIDRSIGE